MSGPQFCAVEISEQVRAYAREHGLTEEQVLAEGLKAKAEQFRQGKSEIYQKA